MAKTGLALLLSTTSAWAQGPPAPVPFEALDPTVAADELVAEGYRWHDDFDPETALARFRSAAGIDPTHYDALWLSAAESVAVGILIADTDGARATRLFKEGVGYARRALAVRPDGVEGHEWLAVALGRHALSVGIRQRVQFAEEILATASRAIELDPNSAVGHHVVGQWHAEVRRVSGFERFIAHRFLGGNTFGSANLDDAVENLERAVFLNPTELVHRFELARIYLDLERFADACREFTQVVDQDLVAPTDPVYKARARDYLGTVREDRRC